MKAASTLRIRARRRAGLVAVVLFMLGAVGAPALDAWVHADDVAADAQEADLHECVVCRLAATPSVPTSTAETMIRTRINEYRPRFTPVSALLRAPPARLTPPTRAPPA